MAVEALNLIEHGFGDFYGGELASSIVAEQVGGGHGQDIVAHIAPPVIASGPHSRRTPSVVQKREGGSGRELFLEQAPAMMSLFSVSTGSSETTLGQRPTLSRGAARPGSQRSHVHQ